MIGTVFKKRPDAHEKGNGEQWQTWMVNSDLGNNIYRCIRVDKTEDLMGTANTNQRTFHKSKIDEYVLHNGRTGI